MIEIIEIDIANAVAFRVAGKITEADMSNAFAAIKSKIAIHGDIVLYEQIDSFSGVEFAGIVDKFNYLSEMGLSNIRKVAIVTDKSWMAKIVALEDKLIRKITIKAFSSEEKEQAIQFLKEA